MSLPSNLFVVSLVVNRNFASRVNRDSNSNLRIVQYFDSVSFNLHNRTLAVCRNVEKCTKTLWFARPAREIRNNECFCTANTKTSLFNLCRERANSFHEQTFKEIYEHLFRKKSSKNRVSHFLDKTSASFSMKKEKEEKKYGSNISFFEDY